MSEAIVTRIAVQPWMEEPETRAVLAALGDSEMARFVGGAVRDVIIGRPIGDIDIATPLPPETVMERLATAGINPVPTGLAHGSVTAVIGSKHFEITTLRRDVETYGRHAKVEFAADWAADATRRDFTMNALFMDSGGTIFDYVGGIEDLNARRVRFVGTAEIRIREDVLRLLRFYRFYAHYGAPPADDAARTAARALVHLLPSLSGERVATELLKLLTAPDPGATLAMMREDGVLAVVLPEAGALDRLAALVPLEPAPDPLRRLAAFIEGGADGVTAIAARLKLSSAQRERLATLVAPPWPVDLAGDERAQRRALHHLGAALYGDLVLLRVATTGDSAPLAALLARAAAWQPVALPVQGRDVTALGMPPGPAVGRLLAGLEEWWEAGDFRADRGECLAELARRVAAG